MFAFTGLFANTFASTPTNPTAKPATNQVQGIKIYDGVYRGDSPRGNPICEIVQTTCLIVVTAGAANPYIEVYDADQILVKTIYDADVDYTEELGDDTYEAYLRYY